MEGSWDTVPAIDDMDDMDATIVFNDMSDYYGDE
jgi:hypothetical protein